MSLVVSKLHAMCQQLQHHLTVLSVSVSFGLAIALRFVREALNVWCNCHLTADLVGQQVLDLLPRLLRVSVLGSYLRVL